MSAFARSTFSAKSYAAFRPTYPKTLYRRLLAYHGAQPPIGTALDLGCGHGLIARELSPHCKTVTAMDPSPGMVQQARDMTSNQQGDYANITFRQGSAEDLGFVDDASVDMAVAGQAAHWFDHARVWPSLARVVKPGGTVACWGYVDNVLLGHEQATAVMESFVYGRGEAGPAAPGLERMGRFWQQPGRDVLRQYLRSVVPPSRDWGAVERLERTPGNREGEQEHESSDEEDVGSGPWQMKKSLRLGEVEAYTRTFSCFAEWQRAYPDKKSRADGGEGDILDAMWDEMRERVPAWKALGERWREANVVSEWGTYLLMARRLKSE